MSIITLAIWVFICFRLLTHTGEKPNKWNQCIAGKMLAKPLVNGNDNINWGSPNLSKKDRRSRNLLSTKPKCGFCSSYISLKKQFWRESTKKQQAIAARQIFEAQKNRSSFSTLGHLSLINPVSQVMPNHSWKVFQILFISKDHLKLSERPSVTFSSYIPSFEVSSENWRLNPIQIKILSIFL